jgi:thiol-disulfide isomerase/thioredoxin
MRESERTPRSRPVHKAALPVFLAAVVILAALAYMREGRSDGGASDNVPFLAKVPAGATAPAFHAQTLSGRTVHFPEEYHGKVVLVDFWATWCVPCVHEFPHLLEAYERFHERGFEIIGISLDAPMGIPATTVESFLRTRKAPWDVIYYNAAPIAGDYRVVGIPAAFLVDGDTGAILASEAQTRGPALIGAIERALKNKAPG